MRLKKLLKKMIDAICILQELVMEMSTQLDQLIEYTEKAAWAKEEDYIRKEIDKDGGE